MNTQLLIVSRAGDRENPRPRITLIGEYLHGLGFVPGALVQAVPVDDGIDFRLCNENIGSFSELFAGTQGMGGGLVRVHHSNAEGHRKGPALASSGRYILSGGLAIGDPIIAVCSPGIIRVRKIDPMKLGFENVRLVAATQIKTRYGDGHVPKVRLSGLWLEGIGFEIGAVATAEAEKGAIALSLMEPDTQYAALMRYLRERGMKLVQVRKEAHNREGKPTPYFGIAGSLIGKAGFQSGDMLACSYEYGKIKFQTPDLFRLGLCLS